MIFGKLNKLKIFRNSQPLQAELLAPMLAQLHEEIQALRQEVKKLTEAINARTN
jgi:hypothetical protein